MTGYKITASRIQRARQIARSVRPIVNWTQRSTLDELSWVLLDLVARDWGEHRITLWLRRLGEECDMPRWRPRAPHRLIAAALRRRAQEEALNAVPADLEHEERHPMTGPNTAFQHATAQLRTQRGGSAEALADEGRPDDESHSGLTIWELAHLREAARTDPALVLAYAHIRGPAAAIAVYGTIAHAILKTPAAYTGYRATL
ncbi:hypothetical protein [Streptomyces sp. NPDC090080]|uniref:hypothetical protein n=1 Tax=Streptomyces sp. NPDC090080 TaxID=3365939 RepID=UPI0037F76FDC